MTAKLLTVTHEVKVSKTARKSAKARNIALAAVEVFAQKGYAATRMTQISAAAGIGKSTIYDYFRTKADLFEAAIQEAGNQWLTDIRAIADLTPDPIERIHHVAARFMQCVEPEESLESRLFIEVVMQTHQQDGVFRHRRHTLLELHRKLVQAVATYILDGISQGVFKPQIAKHAEKIAINLMAYLDGIVLHSMVSKDYIDAERQIDFFIRHFISTLVPEKQ
jgi:AcrR family transcriptional regulator